MNTAISWIAIKGMPSDGVLDALSFTPAAPNERKPKASFGALPNDWIIVMTVDFGFPTPERMHALSAGGVAIACSADDRAMGSVIRGYKDGAAVWAIEHDGGAQGPYHMAVAGDPPPEWPAIRQRLTEEQDKEEGDEGVVDCLFDAPLELGKALCGYRHDEPWPEGEAPPKFTLLVPKKAEGGGLMKALGGLFKRG